MSVPPPVISRSRLQDPEVLQQLDLACREWGVFYVADHGLNTATTERLFTEARRFFSRDAHEKKQVERTRDNPWGYFDAELTKNTRDWKEIFDFGPHIGDWVPQWPRGLTGFRQAYETHYQWCERLSFDLLEAIAHNLGVGGGLLNYAFEPDNSSFMRLNYYPRCPQPAAPEAVTAPDQGHLGVNHHTDSGALTLLMTDSVPGLQVYIRGAWQEVPPLEGALIINLGDVLQVWSNDRYTAPLHRVCCQSNTERMSIPFFFNPSDSCNYAPLGDPAQARYRSINWGEFRNQRVDGDYADLGDEVQISHFRVASLQEGQP